MKAASCGSLPENSTDSAADPPEDSASPRRTSRASGHRKYPISKYSQHRHPHQGIFFRGVAFCSLSEAALGLLMEQFVPGFKVIPGETFQVAIGGGRSVDFFACGIFIEFHPLRIAKGRRHRPNIGYYAGREGRHFCNYNVLACRYFERRRAALDSSEHLRNTELIVATTREEFYLLVIRRFAGSAAPSMEEFLNLFWRAVDLVARLNGLPPLRTLPQIAA